MSMQNRYPKVYQVSKSLEEQLANPVQSCVEQVYRLRVLRSSISPPTIAAYYDYSFQLEDGSQILVDLKSAYKACKYIAPDTVKAMFKRAHQQVDLVVLTRRHLYYLTTTNVISMLSHYPQDSPLDLDVLAQYASVVLEVSQLPNHKQVSETAEQLHAFPTTALRD
jgi:hypothetical protein